MYCNDYVSLSDPLRETEYKLRDRIPKAYSYAVTDPASSMNTARNIAEVLCRHALTSHALTPTGKGTLLECMLNTLRKHPEAMPEICVMHIETLQRWGNYGSHDKNERLTTEDILPALIAMQRLAEWFCQKYGVPPFARPDLTALSNSLTPNQASSDLFMPGTKTSDPFIDTVSFFSRIKETPSNIEGLGMAFHAGAEWRSEPEKVSLMQFILENRIPLRVILNEEKTVRKICEHMQQQGKRYVGFRRCIKEWSELQAEHGDFIRIRISKVPLIHRIYLLQKKDSTGSVNVKYYTYGNCIPAKDHRSNFLSGTPEYKLYTDEFEYLWENSVSPPL